MSFNSFVKHLFAGRELQHKIVRGNEYPMFLLWLVPFTTKEHGIEVCLVFIKKDRNTLEDNIFLGAMLQISESTDIVGTVVTACSSSLLVSSLQLKPSRKGSHSCLHRTSHGCHMLIYGTENTGTIFIVLALNGFVQTHYVASSMISIRLAILVT
jgi:hypothetical protein